jgi:hypothetical protein
MTIEWEQAKRGRIAFMHDNGREAFVEDVGNGYFEYGVKYSLPDCAGMGTVSGIYSVERKCICTNIETAKSNAEKMLTLSFSEFGLLETGSHYRKACEDYFDYAVLLRFGNAVEWVRVHEIVENNDGWVTLNPVVIESGDERGHVLGKYALQRGVSVRKDCIVAVADAPNGS